MMSTPDKNSYSLEEARELMKDVTWETISEGAINEVQVKCSHKEFVTKFTELSKEMKENIKRLDENINWE
jgi:hypothetical protein